VLAGLVPDDPAVTVRLANLAYLTGRPAEAQALARRALDQVGSLADEDVAFFHSFVGSVGFLTGDLDSAEFHHATAAALTPWDQGALGELARVRAATGDYDAAIALLEQANAIQPEPDHLTRLADLYAITGAANPETVQRLFDEGTALATQDADYSRAWARLHAYFLLDHGIDTADALSIAKGELEQRRDAGAWDLYAWALFHNGRLDEARNAADKASATGVINAAFLYHAGVISAELGETSRAIAELEQALSLNPGFEPVHAARATELLDDLRRS
jgi:tetratricopeptide (TPR) repeat protein